jgi:hypothetical protein
MSHRAGYPHVISSLIEESVMGNIVWLHLVTSRVAMAGRRTAHR